VKHPIESITWVEAEKLRANSYNPNVVYTPELRLLEYSLLTTGWIQPVLATQDLEIIDGFHRAHLARTSKKVREMTDGRVPCALLDLTEAERMMLTVRINRAKGSHIAVRMHELVDALIRVHGVTPAEIARQIGATKEEVDLLQQENVFKALNIEKHDYSKAWVPK
jgi:ParB-like chromosome segregation protein Spo0J